MEVIIGTMKDVSTHIFPGGTDMTFMWTLKLKMDVFFPSPPPPPSYIQNVAQTIVSDKQNSTWSSNTNFL